MAKGGSARGVPREEPGVESGRKVQKEYRDEVIRMNKELAENRGDVPGHTGAGRRSRWVERAGERVGDFLAEPQAAKVLAFVVLGAALVVAAIGVWVVFS